MPPSCSKADSKLVQDLVDLSKKSPKLVKSTEAHAPGCEEITVRSWKMNEFKYYDIPSPFPTLARGLFTTKNDGIHRIVIRGYDKFFNIGEVPWTTWPALEANTAAPYVLSLKSNGCIIFIAAITPKKLIVTSKHSVGTGDDSVSHAMMGRTWLNRHLEHKGKQEEDLAAVLWENNWTAVAELCDDSFEEHVLAYSPENTGLHLHGINVCSKAFQTLPHEDVDTFAEEWGFIRTPTITLDSIAQVKELTDDIAKTGKWNGEAVEGFVVRTHVIAPHAKNAATVLTPYEPGSNFFFKVKFDEPYMMYRDWREVTKNLLSIAAKGARMEPSALPKSKMKRRETQLYVKWVIGEIKAHPGAFKEYSKGKGIIATRERFLRVLGSTGAELAEGSAEAGETKAFGKTVIVPVAIPGCGKTSVSLALVRLFGFGHTQSDNIQAKKSGPVFIKNVLKLLEDHDVVIADKNNHLKLHREALRDATSNFHPPVRLLALHWAQTKPPALTHRVCSDRILRRGTNHQTLRPDPVSKTHHEEVVWMFINTSEELTGNEVDDAVEMDIEGSLEEQVRCAVDGVVRILALEKPSEERIQEALAYAEAYTPEVKVADNAKGRKNKTESVRYFALLPELDLVEVLDRALSGERGAEEEDGDESAAGSGTATKELKEFWELLKKEGRVAKRPHVTIAHKNTKKEEPAVWDLCAALHTMGSPPLFEVKLGSLVWNDRVMAVSVDALDLVQEGKEKDGETSDPFVHGIQQLSVEEASGSNKAQKEGQKFINQLPDSIRNRLHITVGTKDGSIAAVEGKELVETWRSAPHAEEDIHSIDLGGVTARGLVKGMLG